VLHESHFGDLHFKVFFELIVILLCLLAVSFLAKH